LHSLGIWSICYMYHSNSNSAKMLSRMGIFDDDIYSWCHIVKSALTLEHICFTPESKVTLILIRKLVDTPLEIISVIFCLLWMKYNWHWHLVMDKKGCTVGKWELLATSAANGAMHLKTTKEVRLLTQNFIDTF